MGAPHLDFEMWESTDPMKLLYPVRDLARVSFAHETSDVILNEVKDL